MDELCVSLSDTNLEISVYRYNQDGDLNGSGTPKVEQWSIQQDDDAEGSYSANKGVSLEDFLSEPDRVMERFAKDAAKVIEVLLKT